jgi:hypothetical protein
MAFIEQLPLGKRSENGETRLKRMRLRSGSHPFWAVQRGSRKGIESHSEKVMRHYQLSAEKLERKTSEGNHLLAAYTRRFEQQEK